MAWGHHVTLTLVMTSFVVLSLNAHHDGADPRACDDMVPQHNSRQRADRPPYYIQLSNTTYSPGVPIKVTLAANSGDFFKGFLIQARISEFGHPDFNKAVGRFAPVEGTKRLCLWDVGLTHTNDDLKSSLTFNWIPPDTLVGKIQFRTTFVQSQYSYWVAQLSDVLNEGETTTSTTTTASTTTTSASTAPSTSSTQQTSTVRPQHHTTYDQTTPTISMNSSSTMPTVGDGGGVSTLTSSMISLLLGLGTSLLLK